jgi:hypothetical protein
LKPNVKPAKNFHKMNVCNCPLVDSLTFASQNLSVTPEMNEKYGALRVVLINTEDSLKYANATIKSHKIVGVDLEGALRSNGYVELV